MIIYVNDRMEIKAVNDSDNELLTPYELSENEHFFDGKSKGFICCYKVNVYPETVTNVIGNKEEKYLNLDNEEVTRTVDVTETVETGKYLISMATPYRDSRWLEIVNMLGLGEEQNTEDIINAEQTITDMDLAQIEAEQQLTDLDLRVLELESK